LSLSVGEVAVCLGHIGLDGDRAAAGFNGIRELPLHRENGAEINQAGKVFGSKRGGLTKILDCLVQAIDARQQESAEVERAGMLGVFGENSAAGIFGLGKSPGAVIGLGGFEEVVNRHQARFYCQSFGGADIPRS
jgi:hypothetical protein